MRKFLQLKLCLLLLSFASFAQTRDVSGRVTNSEDGVAIPGVNVVVKGTTVGTVTDSDGAYRLAVPAGQNILVFSFIGFQTSEVDVGDRSVIDVPMGLDVTQLGEVVVTAAGIERDKKAIGYALQNISADKIIQKSEPDVLRSLQGKVPGLTIAGSGGIAGSSTRITIRGQNSFSGDNQPLFVVDGIPYNNSLANTSNPRDAGALASSRIADLDPNNIASITTLNGAAAAALYGTRAANGVIVIKTKSGSAKASKKGLEVSFNSSISRETVANLPEYQNRYGTGSRSVFAHANGTWGSAYDLLDSIPYYPGYVEAFPQTYTRNGQPILTKYEAFPNNVEDFFNAGKIIDNSISIQAGNEKASVSAVVSDLNQTGFIPESAFKRTNFSVGLNSQLDNGLIVGANIQYSKTRQDGPIVGNTGASPFARLLFQPRNWPLQDLPYINPANGRSVYFFPFGSGVDNPYWSVKNNLQQADVDRIVTTFNIGKDFTDWLNITYKVGYNTYNDRRKLIINKGSSALALNIGQVLLDNISFSELESNLIASITKDINEDISLKALIGHNYNQRINDRQAVGGTGIIANNIFDVDNTGTITAEGGDYEKRRLWAVFGDVTAGFRDYVFLNATIRNDNSSTLPANNRNYIYYGTSLSLILTDAFDIKSNILTSAKLRGSWSRVGRDALPYQLFNSISILNNDGFGTVGTQTLFPFNGRAGATVPNDSFNPNLKPEFTDEWELGTNIDLYNGRVTLDATYYNRLTTNQIARRSTPSASGFTSVYDNFGAIRNKGWEIGMNVVPVQTASGFRWDLGVAFTRNINRVEELSPGIERLAIIPLFTNPQSIAQPGYAFGSIYGSVAATDDQGRYLIDPATGVTIPHTTLQVIGDPNPDFIAGFTNSVSFKGVTLSALFEWKQGGDLFSNTTSFLLGRGTTKDTEDRDVPRVVPGVLGNPNTLKALVDAEGNPIVNNIQIMENDVWFAAQGGGSFGINAPSEFSVFDGTTFRIREVSLSYDLPKAWLTKTPFGSVGLSVTGRNLWYLAPYFPKYTNFDPEVSSLGASNAQGFDLNAAPTTKRVGVNLRVTF
jgi:TonB-linked SusC/RagA family outer membrane protein